MQLVQVAFIRALNVLLIFAYPSFMACAMMDFLMFWYYIFLLNFFFFFVFFSFCIMYFEFNFSQNLAEACE